MPFIANISLFVAQGRSTSIFARAFVQIAVRLERRAQTHARDSGGDALVVALRQCATLAPRPDRESHRYTGSRAAVCFTLGFPEIKLLM